MTKMTNMAHGWLWPFATKAQLAARLTQSNILAREICEHSRGGGPGGGSDAMEPYWNATSGYNENLDGSIGFDYLSRIIRLNLMRTFLYCCSSLFQQRQLKGGTSAASIDIDIMR